MHSRDRVLASKTGFQTHSQFQCLKVRSKVRFYKSCTPAASENEFDHADRILSLKVAILDLIALFYMDSHKSSLN